MDVYDLAVPFRVMAGLLAFFTLMLFIGWLCTWVFDDHDDEEK